MSESGPRPQPTPEPEPSFDKLMELRREMAHIFDRDDVLAMHGEMVEECRQEFAELEMQIETLEGIPGSIQAVEELLMKLSRLKQNLLEYLGAAERSDRIADEAIWKLDYLDRFPHGTVPDDWEEQAAAAYAEERAKHEKGWLYRGAI